MNLSCEQAKELLYRVLRDMILEIRQESYESNLKSIYERADLIHNIPDAFWSRELSEEDRLREALAWLQLYMKNKSQFSEYLLNQARIVKRDINWVRIHIKRIDNNVGTTNTSYRIPKNAFGDYFFYQERGIFQ